MCRREGNVPKEQGEAKLPRLFFILFDFSSLGPWSLSSQFILEL